MKKSLLMILAGMLSGMNASAQNGTELDEVVVTGTRNAADIRHLPMTISVVGDSTLTANHRWSVLPTIGEQVPGLFVTSRGMMGYGVSTGAAGSIKVRGVGGMASLLVLVDGLPQYAGLYGHPIPDACQTLTAERVEVVRGPASLLYGSNAMGGVVNIVTRQMRDDGTKTDVVVQGGSYGTVEGSIVNRIRSGRFSSVTGISYGRTDGHRANSDFGQCSGFMKLGYDMGRNWTLAGDVNVTRFRSSNPGEEQSPLIDNDMKITRGTAAVSVENSYGRTSGAVRVYYNWGHHNINDGYSPGGTPPTQLYLHDDLMGGLSVYQGISLFYGNRLTLGFDYQHFGGKAWNRSLADGARTYIADKEADELAGYADLRQDIMPWLTVDAGLRVDRHSQAGVELVPQGGLIFRLPHDNELRAMVSKGFRNPTIREMYMFPPANDGLEPESMMNYELSYAGKLMAGRVRVGANVFYLKADNLISTSRVDGRMQNVNTGRMENWGVELEAACRAVGRLHLNTNYSYLHTDNPVDGAPEHKLYVGGTWSGGRFTLSSGLQYVAGLYTSSGAGAAQEEFFLWNLTADFRLSEGLGVFVCGDNLLARRYEINAGFPMPRATVRGGIGWQF